MQSVRAKFSKYTNNSYNSTRNKQNQPSVKFKARSGRGTGARRRGGDPASRGLGWQDLPKAAISLLISLYFWRERHLSHLPFLSAHPYSLPLIYLSKSLIFCISEEDVNGKEFPLSARAPRGGDVQEAAPPSSGARGAGN